jgi:hypothetical protein
MYETLINNAIDTDSNIHAPLKEYIPKIKTAYDNRRVVFNKDQGFRL